MVRPSTLVPSMTRLGGARAGVRPEPIPQQIDDTNETASAPIVRKARRKPQTRDLAPVIRSKIQPPPLRASTLSRQRLLERLRDSTSSRLTLLVAEAGYGKTTLLADFAAHSSAPCLWYRLDSSDCDVITWTNHLVAAAREIDPDFGQKTLELLSQVATGGPPTSVFMASLIAELADLGGGPMVLVLDDFHAVDESQEAIGLMSRLLRDAPPWLHFVVSSRRQPRLETGRLAAMGELAELSTDDLRFSRDEIQKLFADGYGLPLEADVLTEVDGRTKGWAASLQLFHGSVRGRPSSAVRALARSLSGSEGPIYDFLAEEVLANLSDEMQGFLVRASLLDRITPELVVALLGNKTPAHSAETARRWIEEADRYGLLARTSRVSDSRQLHPLLRDFLSKQLQQRYRDIEIAAMHVRLAHATRTSDPLTACLHYIEGGDPEEAMRLLGASVMVAMGSGQWGAASELIDRLQDVPADPAVAAIRARYLIEDGDLAGATRLLEGIDVSTSPPDVRAVFRHAKLSLGWRAGDRDLMFATLEEIQQDPETPTILGEIFQVFIDSSSMAATPVPFAALGKRMMKMASSQLTSGHTYYAAISLHNAAITMLAAGHVNEAEEAALQALDVFDNLPGVDSERYSTHAVLALCDLEQGRGASADRHIATALSSGSERGDVHAESAYALATIGESARAEQLLATANDLATQGRSDLTGSIITSFTHALLVGPRDPERGLDQLRAVPHTMPLDTGYDLDRQLLTALMFLLSGDAATASQVAAQARARARELGGRRAVVRLGLVLALANSDAAELRSALTEAATLGDMAALVVADALGEALWLTPELPRELRDSVARWPRRWLPILRHQMDKGRSANAFAAATLLDEYGESIDVGRLRAFAKTYRRSVKTSWSLGRNLARRLSPALVIHDLGRVTLSIADRDVPLGDMRRKAATLLMFLVTRPGLTATREQTLEQLWPESDPSSASNNLNQSLFYLRRDIDPWYEDDISVEYVSFQSDVVWLDAALCRADSSQFVANVRAAMAKPLDHDSVLSLAESYGGQFSPEFEYEEWAMAWRTRVHTQYLQFGNWAINHFVTSADMASARDVAVTVLGKDPTATDIERKLIWLYWHLGHRSAAEAQYDHMAVQERADGIDPPRLRDLLEAPGP
jgi:LuxR family maltose regulon positive regulatory protein